MGSPLSIDDINSSLPQYVPVPSSGPGPTVMVPKGDDNAPLSVDRINTAFDALPKTPASQKKELKPGETVTGTAPVPDTFSDAFRHLGADFSNQMLAGS